MPTDDQLFELLGKNAELFAAYEEWSNAQIMLLAGTVDDPNSFDQAGGKTGALGYYPVVNVSGQTIYIPCQARLMAIALGGANAAVLERLIDQVNGKVDSIDAAVTELGVATSLKFGEIDDHVALKDAQIAASVTAAGVATDLATTKAGLADEKATLAGQKAAAAQVVVDAGAAILAAAKPVTGVVSRTEVLEQTLDGSGPLYFAKMAVIAALADANLRGVFLTDDGVLRGALGVKATARNGLSATYDAESGITTFALGSTDGVVPLTGGATVDTTTQHFVNGLQALLSLEDPSGAFWAAGLEDGSFYIPKLLADLPIFGGANGLTVTTDPVTRKVTISLGSVDKQIPLSGGGMIDTGAALACAAGDLGLALTDSAGALWVGGLLDGRTYLPKLLVDTIELTGGGSLGGADFADAAAATFSAEKPPGSSTIQIVRREKATGRTNVITSLGNNTSPLVSADGRRVIYTSDRSAARVRYSIGVQAGANDETLVVSSSDLVLIGDSRTAGIDGAMRAAFPNRSIDNQGVGGQKSPEIARRFDGGVVVCTLAGNIPASGPVGITIAPDPFTHWNYSTGAMHAVVNGVPGVLTYDNTGAPVRQFTRDVAGAAVPISGNVDGYIDGATVQGSKLIASATPMTSLRQRCAIISPGYNDLAVGFISGGFAYNRATLLANVASIVAALTPMVKNFLIGGYYVGEWALVNGTGGISAGQSNLGAAPNQATALAFVDELYAVNAILKATYPDNYVDLMGALFATWGQTATINGQPRDILTNTALGDGVHATTAAPLNTIAGTYKVVLASKGY